jgi:uncharacterized protein with ParB-like and HNH nuclease domain
MVSKRAELQRRDDRLRAWEHPHRRYVLPAIQREFVWGTDRMCALFDSLMRDYPISSLLYWRVDKENSDEFRWYDFVPNYHELDAPACPAHENLPREERIAVLDGQQRLLSREAPA